MFRSIYVACEPNTGESTTEQLKKTLPRNGLNFRPTTLRNFFFALEHGNM